MKSKRSITAAVLTIIAFSIVIVVMVSRDNEPQPDHSAKADMTEQLPESTISPSPVDALDESPFSLSAQERIYGLSIIWKRSAEMFGLWELLPESFDWDGFYVEYLHQVIDAETIEEYYDILSSFVALLSDGHSGVSYPSDANMYYAPFQASYIDGSYVIVRAISGVNTIPLGSRIILVNGIPTSNYLEDNYGRFIGLQTNLAREERLSRFLTFHRRPETLRLEIITPEGVTMHETVVLRRPYGALNEWDILSLMDQTWKTAIDSVADISHRTGFSVQEHKDSVYRIIIPHFQNPNMPDAVRAYLNDIKDTANGIILDVRGNGGGNSQHGTSVLSHFIDAGRLSFEYGRWQQKNVNQMASASHFGTMAGNNTSMSDEISEGNRMLNNRFYVSSKGYNPGEDYVRLLNEKSLRLYDLPVIILADYNTASAGDDFVATAKNTDRFIIIGTNTMGATGNLARFDLPGGGSYYFTTMRNLTSDDRDITNNGVMPDIWVGQSYEDFLEGIDTQLEFAAQYLKDLMDGK